METEYPDYEDKNKAEASFYMAYENGNLNAYCMYALADAAQHHVSLAKNQKALIDSIAEFQQVEIDKYFKSVEVKQNEEVKNYNGFEVRKFGNQQPSRAERVKNIDARFNSFKSGGLQSRFI